LSETLPRPPEPATAGVPFRFRILLLILGLLVAGMGGLVLSMARWVRLRTEGDISERLARAGRFLDRLHREQSALRALRFEGMAMEPRYVALAQVFQLKDPEATLHQQLEELDFAKRGWVAMGFSSPEGRILEWGGKARGEVDSSIGSILKRAPSPTLLAVRRDVVEVFPVALRPPSESDRTPGSLLVVTPFTSAILDEYALATGSGIELLVGGSLAVASRSAASSARELRSVDVPLAKEMSFRVTLDAEEIARPLREQLRILIIIAVGVVLLGSGASFWLARRMARPIGDLARAARAVGAGDLSIRAREAGAPELRILARNFNDMVQSLYRSREEIKTQAREILDAGERERERIAQDLHDGLGQDLAGIAFHCQALEKKLSAPPSLGGPEALHIIELVRRAIEKARALSRGLFPVGLESNDIEPSLGEMATFVRQTFNVSCQVNWDSRVRIVDRSVATNLYWIAQEAATNAVRHAHPKSIRISVSAIDGKGARLAVRDDGRGMPEQSEGKGGMGLRIMKSRAEMIGADLEIRRHPEGGTLVVCDVVRGIDRV
jgi:signal transduction histidine kinase